MTGYAVATQELPGGALTVEIRAVNNRYLDIQFRLPEELRAIEPALRELLAAKLTRGKIECRVGIAASATAPLAAELNAALLQQLAALNTQVLKVFPQAGSLRAADVLRWPGVLAADTLSADAVRDACRELTATALTEFIAARSREGAKLKDAILAHASAIEALENFRGVVTVASLRQRQCKTKESPHIGRQRDQILVTAGNPLQ